MFDIFFHSEQYDFARKMIKDIDSDCIFETAEIFKDYQNQSELSAISNLFSTKNYLEKILTDKQKIIDSLELLTCQQIHDLTLLIDTITRDDEFITIIFQELTKKRLLTNNNSGRIDFIVPRKTIAFNPNFSRDELRNTLLNLQKNRRKGSEKLLQFSIPDIDRDNETIDFEIERTDEYSPNNFLVSMNETSSYDRKVYAYYSLQQLETLRNKLSIFILNEKSKGE